MKLNRIDTSTFMIFLLFMVFIMGVGFPILFDTSSNYKIKTVDVTIMKNCCDTGYCIKTLDEKVITKISTNDGVKLDTINFVYFQIDEYDVFGCLVDKKIEWKNKYINE